jgi:hypothetical protein
MSKKNYICLIVINGEEVEMKKIIGAMKTIIG